MRILDRILDEMSARGLNRTTAVILSFDQRVQLAKEADETGTYICGHSAPALKLTTTQHKGKA